ncbi:MAG: DEAD/DEAH box helicase family protein, partial [Thermoflexaceae bacterium]|nr:DEAD/DEAH box helicase family protein [Thermoflexaceae bacterium]
MYADIIVDISHDKLDKTFQYKIPEEIIPILEVGMRVNVPFGAGNRRITGFVVNITKTPAFDVNRMKYIDSIVDEKVAIEGRMIKLASFIRENYGGSMNQALKTVIPVKESVKAREKKSIRLIIDKSKAEELLEEFNRKHSVARARLLQVLMEEEVVEYSLVTTKLNISLPVIRFFEENGYIRIETEEYYRNPVKVQTMDSIRNELNAAQKQVVSSILTDYEKGLRKTYLIRGVTGSGKTEVYMAVIEQVIAEEKQVIMLIPEIALTFQTVMRFYKRFGDSVSIMHSRLSKGERYDQFVRAKKGLINIMIGPRSALFTPFENLGLIVID